MFGKNKKNTKTSRTAEAGSDMCATRKTKACAGSRSNSSSKNSK